MERYHWSNREMQRSHWSTFLNFRRYGTFVLLPRFVQPLHDCGLESVDDIARAVATLDCGYLGCVISPTLLPSQSRSLVWSLFDHVSLALF